jgi:hypothetical protein
VQLQHAALDEKTAAEALRKLACLCLDVGWWEDALRAAQRLEQTHSSLDSIQVLAVAHYGNQEYDNSRTVYIRALAAARQISQEAADKVLKGLREAQGVVLWKLPQVPQFTHTVVAPEGWTLRGVWEYSFQGAPLARQFPRSVAPVLGEKATMPTPKLTIT